MAQPISLPAQPPKPSPLRWFFIFFLAFLYFSALYTYVSSTPQLVLQEICHGLGLEATCRSEEAMQQSASYSTLAHVVIGISMIFGVGLLSATSTKLGRAKTFALTSFMFGLAPLSWFFIFLLSWGSFDQVRLHYWRIITLVTSFIAYSCGGILVTFLALFNMVGDLTHSQPNQRPVMFIIIDCMASAGNIVGSQLTGWLIGMSPLLLVGVNSGLLFAAVIWCLCFVHETVSPALQQEPIQWSKANVIGQLNILFPVHSTRKILYKDMAKIYLRLGALFQQQTGQDVLGSFHAMVHRHRQERLSQKPYVAAALPQTTSSRSTSRYLIKPAATKLASSMTVASSLGNNNDSAIALAEGFHSDVTSTDAINIHSSQQEQPQDYQMTNDGDDPSSGSHQQFSFDSAFSQLSLSNLYDEYDPPDAQPEATANAFGLVEGVPALATTETTPSNLLSSLIYYFSPSTIQSRVAENLGYSLQSLSSPQEEDPATEPLLKGGTSHSVFRPSGNVSINTIASLAHQSSSVLHSAPQTPLQQDSYTTRLPRVTSADSIESDDDTIDLLTSELRENDRLFRHLQSTAASSSIDHTNPPDAIAFVHQFDSDTEDDHHHLHHDNYQQHEQEQQQLSTTVPSSDGDHLVAEAFENDDHGIIFTAKNRPQFLRHTNSLLILSICLIVHQLTTIGSQSIDFFFIRQEYNATSHDYSNMLTLSVLAHVVGSFCFFPLVRYMSTEASHEFFGVMICTLIKAILYGLVYCIPPGTHTGYRLFVILHTLVSLFSSIPQGFIRSLLINQVSSNLQAHVFGALAALQVVGLVLSQIAFQAIWALFHKSFPTVIYCLNAVVLGSSMFIIFFMRDTFDEFNLRITMVTMYTKLLAAKPHLFQKHEEIIINNNNNHSMPKE